MRLRLLALAVPSFLLAVPAVAQIAPAGTFGSLPGATFGGTGIPNNAVMIGGTGGVTLGLTATARCAMSVCGPTVGNNAAGTYYAQTGTLTGSPANWASWNWNFYIGGATAGNYNYKLLYDFDPAIGTTMVSLGSLVGNAAGQNSWNLGMGFLATSGGPITAPTFSPFNPNVGGEYTFALLQFDQTGSEVSRVAMNVDVAAVPEPSTWLLMASGLAGVGMFARRRRA